MARVNSNYKYERFKSKTIQSFCSWWHWKLLNCRFQLQLWEQHGSIFCNPVLISTGTFSHQLIVNLRVWSEVSSSSCFCLCLCWCSKPGGARGPKALRCRYPRDRKSLCFRERWRKGMKDSSCINTAILLSFPSATSDALIMTPDQIWCHCEQQRARNRDGSELVQQDTPQRVQGRVSWRDERNGGAAT